MGFPPMHPFSEKGLTMARSPETFRGIRIFHPPFFPLKWDDSASSGGNGDR
jgi:hypothetical protein